MGYRKVSCHAHEGFVLTLDLSRLMGVSLTDEEVGTAADAMKYLTAVIGAAAGLVDDDSIH